MKRLTLTNASGYMRWQWSAMFGALALSAAVLSPWPWVRWLNIGSATVNFAFAVINYREDRHGRHREAEEDSRDSDTAEATLNYTFSGSVPGCSCSLCTGAYLARTVTATGTNPYATSPFTASLKALTEKPAIERVEDDQPILAHRAAKLRFDGTDKHWASVTDYGHPFGVDADAKCRKDYPYFTNPFGSGKSHTAPDVDCFCGFYALPSDLPATYEDATTVTLLVELSGTVIEHEKGYRAAHQRVIGCELPPCPYCGAQADAVLVSERQMVEAVCQHHAPVPAAGEVFVKVEDVAALLPVSVTRAGRVNA